MKHFIRLSICTFLFSLLSIPTFAATQKDRMVGTWQINAEVNAEVFYKNWAGSITVTKQGNSYSAVLDWRSSEGDWHVIQDMSVSKSGKQITLQSTNVNIIAHPEALSEYNPDTFTFSLDDKTGNSFPVSAGDSRGVSMTFTISKS